jgi:hypothetical protein
LRTLRVRWREDARREERFSASDRPRGTIRPGYLWRLSHEGDPKMHTRERKISYLRRSHTRAFLPSRSRSHAAGPIPRGDKGTASI